LAAALLGGGCLGIASQPKADATHQTRSIEFFRADLTVTTLWTTVATGTVRHTYRLECSPSGGTFPEAPSACLQLNTQPERMLGRPSRRAAPLYGGSATILIDGTYSGKTVHKSYAMGDFPQSFAWGRLLDGLPNLGDDATPAPTSVDVRIERTVPPHRMVRLDIRCPAATTSRWVSLCTAIAADPALYLNDTVIPGCIGGLPATLMRVDGIIHGQEAHLRQSGMCGPKGVTAWYTAIRTSRET